MPAHIPHPRRAPRQQPEFRFGLECGQHCGEMRHGKLAHCPTCHALAKVARAERQH